VASIAKSPKSRYWIAAFRDASGKQIRRSTRETDRKRALAVALAFERAAKSKGSPQRVRQVLSEFLRDHFSGDQALPQATLAACCQQWLAARKAETSPGTHRHYEVAVKKFLGFLGPHADRSIEEVTRTQISAFRDAELIRTAVATANTNLKIIRRIFRSARMDGLLFQDPTEGVKTIKNRASLKRRPFTITELRAVLDVAGPEWQSLIKFGLYTGQRLGDLAALTWTQIDLQREELRIVARKTGKSLLIPIATPLHQHILSLPAADNPRSPVHPKAFETVHAQNGRVGTLSNHFAELLANAGLREPQPHHSKGIGRSAKRSGSELSFHSLRHTAVSLLKDAGIPDAVVMALVGHQSAAISHRYTHVGIDALQKAADSLPNL
jgi:integrase